MINAIYRAVRKWARRRLYKFFDWAWDRVDRLILRLETVRDEIAALCDALGE